MLMFIFNRMKNSVSKFLWRENGKCIMLSVFVLGAIFLVRRVSFRILEFLIKILESVQWLDSHKIMKYIS